MCRCLSTDTAASEFKHQLQRDVEMVADRFRKCVDEADRVEQERHQFVDAIDKTATTIRETVSYTASYIAIFCEIIILY